MTEKQIKQFINRLNSNNANEEIFLRPLSDTIDFAIVWDSYRHPLTKVKNLYPSFDFYFIKNSERNYVAAVLDMKSDLHWFVLPKHRGKGILTQSLQTTILPHLFQDNRKEQRITIDKNAIGDKNYTKSIRVAESLGFIRTEENTDKTILTLSANENINTIYFDGYNTEMPPERVKTLKDRVREIAKELLKIESEFEMKLGFSEDIEEFKEIAKTVDRIPNLIDDAYYSRK